MNEIIFLIENRKRGPVAGTFDEWNVDESSPIMTNSQMAERQAREWNDEYPHLDHRVAPFVRWKGGK